MKLFNYIFYRVCDFYKKKKDSAAEQSGSLIVSLLQFFTLLDIFIIVRIFWEYPIPTYINENKYWVLPVGIILAVVNWYKYEKTKAFRKYRKVWKDEKLEIRRRKGKLIIVYIIASILIPVLYGLIRHNLMEDKSFFG
ncbi:MAG: hypothetical protein K8R58_14190 [Bacteroidales bacterium]|nr:hypothetical protein [Bacteroidales bacterium]